VQTFTREAFAVDDFGFSRRCWSLDLNTRVGI